MNCFVYANLYETLIILQTFYLSIFRPRAAYSDPLNWCSENLSGAEVALRVFFRFAWNLQDHTLRIEEYSVHHFFLWLKFPCDFKRCSLFDLLISHSSTSGVAQKGRFISHRQSWFLQADLAYYFYIFFRICGPYFNITPLFSSFKIWGTLRTESFLGRQALRYSVTKGDEWTSTLSAASWIQFRVFSSVTAFVAAVTKGHAISNFVTLPMFSEIPEFPLLKFRTHRNTVDLDAEVHKACACNIL